MYSHQKNTKNMYRVSEKMKEVILCYNKKLCKSILGNDQKLKRFLCFEFLEKSLNYK